MKFYRKQPIEAEQFDGSQESLFGYEVMADSLVDALTGEPAYYSILIDDIESEPDDFPDDNEVSFEIGDWIVKDADEIKVLTDEEFQQQYTELPVIPKAVADWTERGKSKHIILDTALMLLFCARSGSPEISGVSKWIWSTHMANIAIAWAIGYQVEEEK